MKPILHGVSLWILLQTLTACNVLAPPAEVQSPELGMVFGNIKTSEQIERIEFREFGKFYLPPFRVPPRVMVFDNGDFMVENLKPGKYYIAAVYSRFKDFTLVKDNRTAYQNVIIVEPGAIKYAGSYVIHEVADAARFRQNLILRKVRKPAEREILKNLYVVTEGTGWQTRIDRRMHELHM